MKYFIDFEATQSSNEIISIGAVREDGQTFYSLIAPVKGKVTPFITNLTGITEQMVENAMSANAVFENFYLWAFTDEIAPEFIVWGSSDIDFLQETFNHATNLKAKMVIGYMRTALQDYHKIFCNKFRLSSLSLLKAMQVFEPTAVQNHNALDDAFMLYNIYSFYESKTFEEMQPIFQKLFPKKIKIEESKKDPKQNPKYWENLKLPIGTICMNRTNGYCVEHWDTIEEAAEWLMENVMKNPAVRVESVVKSIKKVLDTKKTYCAKQWRQVKEEKQ